jgi:hypothetical protein
MYRGKDLDSERGRCESCLIKKKSVDRAYFFRDRGEMT